MKSSIDAYEIPAFEKYYPLFCWGVLILMIIGMITAARYNLWVDKRHPITLHQAILIVSLALLFAIGISIRYWFVDAPYRVVSLQWNDEEITLTPQRGSKVFLHWSDISNAQLPSYSGPEYANGAHYYRAYLFVSGGNPAYVLPLSYSESCKRFINILQERVPNFLIS